MKVTRDVVVDLLPLYLAGEASPDTRALVEEFLAQDAELEQRLRRQSEEGLLGGAPVVLPPELELRSLRRTRSLLALQRWLFGFGICFSAFALTSQISFNDRWRITDFQFLIGKYPVPFGVCALLAAGCWTTYVLLRRRLRIG